MSSPNPNDPASAVPVVATSAATLPSRVHGELAAAWADATPMGADTQAFWVAWQEDGGAPCANPADFAAACATADGAVEAMDHVHAVMTGPEGRERARRLSPASRRLVQALMMVAVDAYLRHTLLAGQAFDGDPCRHAVRDPLLADLLAAVSRDCGAWLERHPNGVLYASNVRWDTPAAEYGQGEAGQDVWMAEIQAWADTMHNGQALLGQMLRPERLPTGDVPDPVRLRSALRRIERTRGVRPVAAARAGGLAPLVTDPALRRFLLDEFGIASVILPEADAVALDRLVAKVQGTVRDCVAGLFDAMLPLATAVSPPPAPNRRHIFISYAHADGDEWMQRVCTHLSGLPAGAELKPWSDRDLNTGDDWLARIEAALQGCAGAVLVLTPAFLESPFITRVELSQLLLRRKGEGMRLFPIQARTCVWDTRPELSSLQTRAASTALNALNEGEQDAALANLARDVLQLLKPAQKTPP